MSKIYKASTKTRAHNMMIRYLMNKVDNTATRNELIDFLLTTRYASTAVSHLMSYCNDMIKYENAIVSYKKVNRIVTHVTLHNAFMFDIDTMHKRSVHIDFSAITNDNVADVQTHATDVLTIDVSDYTVLDDEVLCDAVKHASDDVALLTYDNANVLLLTHDMKTTVKRNRKSKKAA